MSEQFGCCESLGWFFPQQALEETLSFRRQTLWHTALASADFGEERGRVGVVKRVTAYQHGVKHHPQAPHVGHFTGVWCRAAEDRSASCRAHSTTIPCDFTLFLSFLHCMPTLLHPSLSRPIHLRFGSLPSAALWISVLHHSASAPLSLSLPLSVLLSHYHTPACPSRGTAPLLTFTQLHTLIFFICASFLYNVFEKYLLCSIDIMLSCVLHSSI